MTKYNDINLSDIDPKSFLQRGIILQIPNTTRIKIGINHALDPAGCFYLTGFYGGIRQRFCVEHEFELEVSDFIDWVEKILLKEKTQIEMVQNFDQEFQKDAITCLDLIRDEHLKKLVPVTYAKYRFIRKSHPLSQINNLSQLNGNIYGIWGGGTNFIGVTPEPLFLLRGDSGYSKALAGTTFLNDGEILNDPKEMEEHKLVVDDMEEKLLAIANSLSLDGPKLVNYANISHIQTDINFKVENFDYEEFVAKLSPTAALGGFPSRDVYTYMRTLLYYDYKKDARFFGGTLGYSSKEIAFSLVNIRNIFWNDDELTIHSGCGIVAGSIIKKELVEVKAKRDTIANIYE
jgi:menaquinone-specific isochorismate synthase